MDKLSDEAKREMDREMLYVSKVQATIRDLKKQVVQYQCEADTYKIKSELYLRQKNMALERAYVLEARYAQTTHIMKQIFIYAVEPPVEVADMFEPFDFYPAPEPDELFCFEVSFHKHEGLLVDTLYIKNDMSLPMLSLKLHGQNFTLVGNDAIHATIYKGTLTKLRTFANDLF